jgi:hypothetical protein
VVSILLATIFEFLGLLLFHGAGLNHISSGPSALVFSILYQYLRIVPSAYQFRIFGVTLSDKSFSYILASQVSLGGRLLHNMCHMDESIFVILSTITKWLAALGLRILCLLLLSACSRSFTRFCGSRHNWHPYGSNLPLRACESQIVSNTIVYPSLLHAFSVAPHWFYASTTSSQPGSAGRVEDNIG